MDDDTQAVAHLHSVLSQDAVVADVEVSAHLHGPFRSAIGGIDELQTAPIQPIAFPGCSEDS